MRARVFFSFGRLEGGSVRRPLQSAFNLNYFGDVVMFRFVCQIIWAIFNSISLLSKNTAAREQPTVEYQVRNSK
jgi:hypothetical protein